MKGFASLLLLLLLAVFFLVFPATSSASVARINSADHAGHGSSHQPQPRETSQLISLSHAQDPEAGHFLPPTPPPPGADASADATERLCGLLLYTAMHLAMFWIISHGCKELMFRTPSIALKVVLAALVVVQGAALWKLLTMLWEDWADGIDDWHHRIDE